MLAAYRQNAIGDCPNRFLAIVRQGALSSAKACADIESGPAPPQSRR
jgi:hypothetical protein